MDKTQVDAAGQHGTMIREVCALRLVGLDGSSVTVAAGGEFIKIGSQ